MNETLLTMIVLREEELVGGELGCCQNGTLASKFRGNLWGANERFGYDAMVQKLPSVFHFCHCEV